MTVENGDAGTGEQQELIDDSNGAGDGGESGGDAGGEDLGAVVKELRGSVQRLTAENKRLARQLTQSSPSDDGDNGDDDGAGDDTGKGGESTDDLKAMLRKEQRARKAAEAKARKADSLSSERGTEVEKLRRQVLLGDLATATGIANQSTLQALMTQARTEGRVDEGPEDFETPDARKALAGQYMDAIKDLSPELFGASDSGGGRRGTAGVSTRTKTTGEKPDAGGGSFSVEAAHENLSTRLYGEKKN